MYVCMYVCIRMGFPSGSVVKNPPTNAGNMSSIPGSGRLNWRFNLQDSPGGGDGNPLQYPCWEILWTEGSGGLQFMESQKSWTQLRT